MELNLCMRCMKELGKGETVCPFCGFDAGKQTAAPHNLPYGSVLNGRYMTGAVLGEGGFGVTYIGYELNLGIRIAIKEFYPFGFVGRESTQSLSVRSYSNAADFFAQGKEKFLKEARSIAQFMKLPGIVTVRDFFLENNTAYIVMDYIEGTSLKQYAQGRKGKIPSEELLPLLQPIVQSLIEVHERGVIHRDISPDNILIDTDGKAWLIDFGAAREVSPEGERTLSVTLKKGYTPEEQYRTHGEQGPWTDVYSMCATIYAMLTGVKPDEPFDRLEEETLRPPRTLGASLTVRQEETLLKGLAIRAKDRLQSMEEVYNGLYVARVKETESKKEADTAGAGVVSATSSGTDKVSDTGEGAGSGFFAKLFGTTARKVICVVMIEAIVMTGVVVSQFKQSADIQPEIKQSADIQPEMPKSEYFLFGTYEQDGNTANGKEPIEWEILAEEDDRMLIVSHYVLDAQDYHKAYTDVVWATCSLRFWLNGDFYDTAFSSQEQNRILDTTITNQDNPYRGTPGGPDTTDRVFLLSLDEILEYYDFNYWNVTYMDGYCEDLIVEATPYAESKGVRTSYIGDIGFHSTNRARLSDEGLSLEAIGYSRDAIRGSCARWWLRSTGSDQCHACVVSGSGYTGAFKSDAVYWRYNKDGVRPAMWISK